MFEPEELMARIVDLEEQLKVSEMAPPAAEQLIACLEGEIAKRDEELAACRVAVENCDLFLVRIAELEHRCGVYGLDLHNATERLQQAERQIKAIKAQEPVTNDESGLEAWAAGKFGVGGAFRGELCGNTDWALARLVWSAALAYAAPVSEAKAQGEYGEAYQGAREDLAIWKRRALEAEEKVLQQEQIIDHLTSEAQGESRFGEPVVTPDAPCVPDGYVLADKKALGTVLQALVNAPHHIRELQVTRQPVELFSDNPINVLIANYEAPAAPAQQPKCKTCDDNGRIGGPSFYAPDEGGEPCPDCCSPVQQVSVPDEMRSLAQRLREYNQNPHHINPMSEAFHILVADAANALSTACVPKEIAAAITWSEHLLFECGALTSTRAPSVHAYNKTFAAVNEARAMIAAAPAAPAADAGHVFYGMDGNHP